MGLDIYTNGEGEAKATGMANQAPHGPYDAYPLSQRDARIAHLEAALDLSEEHNQQKDAEIICLREQLGRVSKVADGAIELLRGKQHHMRGLLETVIDAWESGHYNSSIGMQQLHLTREWRTEAKRSIA